MGPCAMGWVTLPSFVVQVTGSRTRPAQMADEKLRTFYGVEGADQFPLSFGDEISTILKNYNNIGTHLHIVEKKSRIVEQQSQRIT